MCTSINLDIAIDLNGYTKYSKPEIFQKISTGQINFLGYPGTMGSKNYDYIVADKTIIPENFKNYYSENIIYLPDTYFINPSCRPISSMIFTKEDLSIPKDAFVYCCFNQNYKILPSVFDTWMNILKQVKGSILLLSHANHRAISNLKNEAKKEMLILMIIFTTYITNIADHLKDMIADLFLDTMPYNAHTTASDAICQVYL